ncbi:MAG: hypothetical protein ACRDDY_14025 [Clostridium sp.]|uniref:hypothetical protein n=1 Tax=Clostridium sp. TaxID=1506 RepID=UPI003EE64F69
MKYRVYLGHIEDNLLEIHRELASDEAYGLFAHPRDEVEDIMLNDVLFAYSVYCYVFMRILRNDDDEDELDDEDAELVTAAIAKVLDRVKDEEIISNYLECQEITTWELAVEILDIVEDSFKAMSVVNSVAYQMAIVELYDEFEPDHAIYVAKSTNIDLHISVETGMVARGSVEIEYD